MHEIIFLRCITFSLLFIEFLVLASLSKINEAVNSNDPAVILACLQLPSAKLNNVRPKNAELYMIILKEAKKEKAEVSGKLKQSISEAR